MTIVAGKELAPADDAEQLPVDPNVVGRALRATFHQHFATRPIDVASAACWSDLHHSLIQSITQIGTAYTTNRRGAHPVERIIAIGSIAVPPRFAVEIAGGTIDESAPLRTAECCEPVVVRRSSISYEAAQRRLILAVATLVPSIT